MLAYLSKRALRTVDRINTRWQTHAEVAMIFATEFAEAIDRIEAAAAIGLPFPTKIRPNMRRLLLSKSKVHLYYRVDEAVQMIEIVELWDGRRRPPKL